MIYARSVVEGGGKALIPLDRVLIYITPPYTQDMVRYKHKRAKGETNRKGSESLEPRWVE
jgi:hypothetical protein